MVVNFTRFLSTLILPVLLATNAVQAQNSGHGTFICKTYGRFANPSDCMSYFECFPTFTSARLTAKKQRCPTGKGFHDKLKKCASLKKLKECNSRQGRFESLNQDLNPLCAASDTHFLCADCQTLVHCIVGNAYVTECDTSLSCSVKSPFDNGVCDSNQNVQNCSCSSKGNNTTYNPDPYDDTKFFSCDSTESLPEHFECPINRRFDATMQKCVDEKDLPSCTADGMFSVPENCTKYYSCLQTKYGWLQKPFECPPNLMYSEGTGGCEDPCNWQSGEFRCKKEGRFINPSDCGTFYVCVEIETGFILKKRRCPNSYVWSSNTDNSSGKCTEDLGQCKPAPTHQCVLPSGRCNATESENLNISAGSQASAPLTTAKPSESVMGDPNTTVATTTDNENSAAVTDNENSAAVTDNEDSTTATPVGENLETVTQQDPDADATSAVELSDMEGPESTTDTTGIEDIETTELPISPVLRTGSELFKKEDPIAFIRNLLNRT